MRDTTTNRRSRFSATGARLRSHGPLLSLACLLASACAVGPDYVRPEPPLPGGWQSEGPGISSAAAQEVGRWWDAFGDPELSALVARATVANLDLAQAIS